MDDIRELAPVKRGDRGKRAAGAEDPVATPAPCQRAQSEPLGADLLAVTLDPRRDDDLEPGIARGARHRQAVRPEIPILGDQEGQLWPRLQGLRRCDGDRDSRGQQHAQTGQHGEHAGRRLAARRRPV